MKFRYFALILIFLLGVSFVCATEFDLLGCSFEVPEGYYINSTSDTSVTLLRNNSSDYRIFVFADSAQDNKSDIFSRQSAGFIFISEDNFTSENGINITQQVYSKNESYYSYYSFKMNETSYVIGYAFPVDDDLENSNPVESLINSIKQK